MTTPAPDGPHPLATEEVALWASEHARCPNGDCTAVDFEGIEAAYSCQHCMDRRRDIEQLLEPCDHRLAESPPPIRNPAARPHRTDAGDELIFYMAGLVADIPRDRQATILDSAAEYVGRVEDEASASAQNQAPEAATSRRVSDPDRPWGKAW